MPTIFIVVFFVALGLDAKSFPEVLLAKREATLSAIGAARYQFIETYSRSREIYRITQLLDIPGVGEKMVIKLGGILGYRFGYQPSIDDCVKMQSC